MARRCRKQRRRCRGASCSSQPDAGVEVRIEDVDDDVDEDERRGEQEDGRLHHRVVAVVDGLHRQPRSVPSSMPTMVTIGMAAFFSACFHTTGGSLTPFARAVRM